MRIGVSLLGAGRRTSNVGADGQIGLDPFGPRRRLGAGGVLGMLAGVGPKLVAVGRGPRRARPRMRPATGPKSELAAPRGSHRRRDAIPARASGNRSKNRAAEFGSAVRSGRHALDLPSADVDAENLGARSGKLDDAGIGASRSSTSTTAHGLHPPLSHRPDHPLGPLADARITRTGACKNTAGPRTPRMEDFCR